MSEFSEWFGMKSAKQKALDARNYNRWAFPQQQIDEFLQYPPKNAATCHGRNHGAAFV